jgi:hypothetical protein
MTTPTPLRVPVHTPAPYYMRNDPLAILLRKLGKLETEYPADLLEARRAEFTRQIQIKNAGSADTLPGGL